MYGGFGFIHEKLDIKILILFILRRLPEAVPFDVLTELTLCDDGISYFDFAECVAELVDTEHLRIVDNKYALTGKGSRNGEITENNLPYTVRMRAEKATSILRAALNRNAMIKTSHTQNEDGGCTVLLSLSDGIGDIITMSMFAANDKQAIQLEKGFRERAELIYNGLIEMILGENKKDEKSDKTDTESE